MRRFERPAAPLTLTSLGRIAGPTSPGPANMLKGWQRLKEIWQRYRLVDGVLGASLLTLASVVCGVTLSGFPVSRVAKP